MIKIKEALIVEGKYDKIKLSQIFDTVIIKTDGFRIYKDKKTIELIKKLADKSGVIILTDSDNSGLMIRNHLKNVLSDKNVKHAFTPAIKGKEKRKKTASKAGFLGVEGINDEEIIKTVLSCSESFCETDIIKEKEKITRLDLYKIELFGKENSNIIRKKVLNELNLPENMSVSMLLDVLNGFYTKEYLENLVNNIKLS